MLLRRISGEIKLLLSLKMAVFWDVAPYSLVDIGRFRGAYCLPRQGDISQFI
jgi:hypothetical protein